MNYGGSASIGNHARFMVPQGGMVSSPMGY
jgi:hypothetical protein